MVFRTPIFILLATAVFAVTPELRAEEAAVQAAPLVSDKDKPVLPGGELRSFVAARRALELGFPSVAAGLYTELLGSLRTTGAERDVLVLELVTAMQFAFIFHYPEGNITSGELHVSAGQPVQLRMEARDVIHAFWVPQFRLKQDIIPGQPTLLSFTPTKPGTYPIVCAELCGPYHGGMRTNVVVHDPDSFQTWLDQNRQPAISA